VYHCPAAAQAAEAAAMHKAPPANKDGGTAYRLWTWGAAQCMTKGRLLLRYAASSPNL
jgi:hypothetical protein